MEIRVLTEADAEAYWALRLEALETEARAFGSSAEEHRSFSLEQTVERIRVKESGDFVMGAFEDGRLVGTVGFSRETRTKMRHKGKFSGVYVSHAARGRGVAKNLLLAAIERLRSYGDLRQVILAVAVQQRAAERLYRAAGFEEFGLERAALKVGDEYIDERWMVLEVQK